jgi:SAM-dependent methyltransferase
MQLSKRSNDIEVMDDLNCSGSVLNQSLRELEFINATLGGNAVTLSALNRLFKGKDKKAVYAIADLGCGGGDMARHILNWGKRHGYLFKVFGIDANPNVIEFARKNISAHPEIQFQTLNIFSEEFDRINVDVVIGTLFYHHFRSEELVAFFRKLRSQAKLAIIINDIHRHPLAYYSIKYLTAIFSKSSMVQNDAPLSVARAFTRRELEGILRDAGYTNYSIKWKWAFRWQVVAYTQE